MRNVDPWELDFRYSIPPTLAAPTVSGFATNPASSKVNLDCEPSWISTSARKIVALGLRSGRSFGTPFAFRFECDDMYYMRFATLTGCFRRPQKPDPVEGRRRHNGGV